MLFEDYMDYMFCYTVNKFFNFSKKCLIFFNLGIENLWNILFQKFDMFLWMSGFQNPLVHTDFDMFVDE